MSKLKLIEWSSKILFGLVLAFGLTLFGKVFGFEGLLVMGVLSNYGEIFSRNVLKKVYARAITPVVANTDYEGEIKKMGDRVNVLMFLDDIALGDYTVGSDMTVQNPSDTEAQLIINQKKYYNFDIDAVDKQFTYVEDEDSVLIENAAKALEKAIDKRLLDSQIEEVKAGNRVTSKGTAGNWTFVVGNTGSFVTITTSATVATLTLTGAIGENHADEVEYFPVNIVGRGVRVMSTLVNGPWWRVTTRTSSTAIDVNRWDGGIQGGGQIVDGVAGIGGDPQFDGAGIGYGCEIEGMISTQVTSSNIYQLITELATALDDDDVPQENRHLSVPPWFKNILVRASQIQPAIAVVYEDVVKNGLVAKVAGFEVHMVSDDRFSTNADPIGSWVVSNTGYKILANHISFVTFAHAWSESRVIDAEKQFAKLYQGLNLYGFKVLNLRRKAGAYLFGYQ